LVIPNQSVSSLFKVWVKLLTYPTPHLAALLYGGEVAFDEDIFRGGERLVF
jgi:hypothetical protein